MIGIVYEIQIGPYKQIGSTHNLKERTYHHLNLLTKNKHYNQFLQRTYNKYSTFEMVELYRFPTREEGYKKEQELLDEFYRQPYYMMEHPMAIGGSKPGKEHPCYGRKKSLKEIENIRKVHTGKIVSYETRELQRENAKGKVTCKDLNGNTFRVTKKEYDRRDDLTGITSGSIITNSRKYVRCLEDNKEILGVVECGKHYGVPPGQISEQLKGKRDHVGLKKYVGGLHFELVASE